jgi:uncharacterized protein YfiM (DUF2279 family)
VILASARNTAVVTATVLVLMAITVAAAEADYSQYRGISTRRSTRGGTAYKRVFNRSWLTSNA